MGGFSSITGDPIGTVMNADNCCFDGTARGTVINTDGQLWIGSTTTPHILVGTITSTGGSVVVTNGHGTINLETSGPSALNWVIIGSTTISGIVGKGYFVNGSSTINLPNPGVNAGGNMGFITTPSGATILNAYAGQTITIGKNTGVTATNNASGDSLNLIWGGSVLGTWFAFGGPEGTWTLS